MELSSDILKNFADITTSKEKKGDTKIYATLVQNGKGVKLDGANSGAISPLVKSVKGETGDRVEVVIKDHQVSVVNNLSEKSRNDKAIDKRFKAMDEKVNNVKHETVVVETNVAEEIDLTDIYESIDMLFTSVSDGKKKIADAITDKGVKSSADETFEELSKDIESISTNKPKAHISHRKANKVELGVTVSCSYVRS